MSTVNATIDIGENSAAEIAELLEQFPKGKRVRIAMTEEPSPPVGDKPWTDEHNDRRCELIDRLISETISKEERTELDQLQAAMRLHLNETTLFDLDAARAVHHDLLQARK